MAVSTANAVPMDDNISIGTDERIICRHCTHVLSGGSNTPLQLALRDSPSRDAGPSVVVDPAMLLDEPIVFREYFCPGCFTRLHCAIVPAGHVDILSGLRVATPQPVSS